MATVHTSVQPRVAQFCSVSRMPSLVAVVSGRAVHFNGWIQDSRSVKNFIKSVLPASAVVKVGGDWVRLIFDGQFLVGRPMCLCTKVFRCKGNKPDT